MVGKNVFTLGARAKSIKPLLNVYRVVFLSPPAKQPGVTP